MDTLDWAVFTGNSTGASGDQLGKIIFQLINYLTDFVYNQSSLAGQTREDHIPNSISSNTILQTKV